MGADESSNDSPLSFSAALGIQSEGQTDVSMNLGWSSAAALVHGQRLRVVSEPSAPTIRLRSSPEDNDEGVEEWSIDRSTGRLIEVIYTEAGQETFRAWTSETGLSIPSEIPEIDRLNNVYDPARPHWSCLGFAIEHLLPIDAFVNTPERAADVKAALPIFVQVSRNILQSLFPSARKAQDVNAVFSIPMSRPSEENLMAGLVLAVFQNVQGLFEPGSWPSSLFRQALMVITQRTNAIGPELHRLSLDPNLGPLGHLAFSRALGVLGHPGARVFAKQGLDRVSNEGFIRDLSLLYRGTGKMAVAGRSIIEGIRSLSEDELKRLVKLALPHHTPNSSRRSTP